MEYIGEDIGEDIVGEILGEILGEANLDVIEGDGAFIFEIAEDCLLGKLIV
jgi:hypothetical protein